MRSKTRLSSKVLLTVVGSFACIAASYANAPISQLALENTSPYYYLYSSSNQGDGACNEQCYPSLQPNGSQQWVNLWTNTSWIDLEYDVCDEISYDGVGNASCTTLLGHFGITFTGNKTTISNQDLGEVELKPNANYTVFKANFKPINIPDRTVPEASQYETIPFRGANIAAAEFTSQDGNIDWIVKGAFPKQKDLSYFGKSGMNTFRFPIRWSYLQSKKGGDFNQAYLDALIASTKLYLEAGYNVIIDLHNYMHFQPDATKEPVNSGELVQSDDLVQIWDKVSIALRSLAIKYPNRSNKNQLMFDLMNEPTNDINSGTLVSYYNAVIKTIRHNGLNNLILLEGAHYSGMHSWNTQLDQNGQTNADAFTADKIIDPEKRYAINVHQYFDSNYSGTELKCTGYPKENVSLFLNWARGQQIPYMVTEFGGPDQGGCQPIIDDFLKTLESDNASAGNFLGWTAWAGGSHWGNYPLSIAPGGGAEKLPAYLVASQHLKG